MVDQTIGEGRLTTTRKTEVQLRPTKRAFQPTCDYAIVSFVTAALTIMFFLGMGNFALHRAVLESGHPLVGQLPDFAQLLGGRLTLIAEFLVLLAAMLLAANGWAGLVWAYGFYTALNAVSAWLILSGRI